MVAITEKTEGQGERQIERQTERWAERQIERQTARQTGEAEIIYVKININVAEVKSIY